jgi:arylsulfatase A-like enzyme
MDGLEDWRFRESTDGDAFEAYRDARVRAYDAAIRGADDALAGLLEGIDDDTVVVVCGDHGEAFWEHVALERRLNDDPRGYYGTDHGHSVLEDVARVPLWIRAPDVDVGRDDTPTSLTAVAPVVLDALDATVAADLAPAPLSAVRDGHVPLCEETGYGYNQRAIWLDDRKAVEVTATDTTLAFDVGDGSEGDPREDVPADLRDALDAYGDGVAGDDEIDVDDATRDRLAELGYLE